MTERHQIEELKCLLNITIEELRSYRRQHEAEWEEPIYMAEFIPFDAEDYEARFNEALHQINNPYRCSACKERTDRKTKCCPNCGTRMKGV